MHSVIFNNATISFDSPVDMYIIQGKLMIDTASYGNSKPVKQVAVKPAKSKAPKSNYGLTQFLRDSKLRVGKKILVTANSKKTIYGAVKKLGYTASIRDTDTPNEFMVTCLK